MRRALLVFVILAGIYCGAGLFPGRVLAPVDMVADAGAWKGNLVSRVAVSNSLLSDVVTQFMAWDAETLRLLRHGELPWRNRWAGDGAPLFANPQTALLSPFTWPRLLFGDAGWALCAMLRMLVAGLAMTWLARAMGATPNAAIISGVVYATSGFGVCWLLYPLANVFAVLPALAAAALQRRNGLVILFAALATIGGHPETLFCGVVAIAILGGWRMWKPALAGFLLCGVQLVPFLRILWLSDERVVRASATPPAIRWSSILGTILPGFLGSPLKGELDLTALQPLPENFILRSEAFVGFIVLVVVALTWRRLPPPFRRGLAIALVAFVLLLRLPGLRLIVKVVPMAVEYFSVVFVLFVAAAAGPALEEIGGGQAPPPVPVARGDRRGRLSSTFLLALGLLLALAGATVALPATRPLLAASARSGIARLRARGVLHKPAEVYEARLNGYLAGASATAARRLLLPGLCWVVAGFGLATRRRRVVIAAAVAELLAFGLGFNPAVARVTTIPPPLVQVHALDPTHEYYAASSLEVFPANLGTLYAVRDAVSYDALQSHTRVQALAAAGYDRVTHSLPQTPNPTMAALGVRWIITPGGVVEVPNAQHPPAANNERPEGLAWGIAVSVIGALLAVMVFPSPRRSGEKVPRRGG